MKMRMSTLEDCYPQVVKRCFRWSQKTWYDRVYSHLHARKVLLYMDKCDLEATCMLYSAGNAVMQTWWNSLLFFPVPN